MTGMIEGFSIPVFFWVKHSTKEVFLGVSSVVKMTTRCKDKFKWYDE